MANILDACAVKSCLSQKTGRKKYCRKHQTRYERHGDPNIVQRTAIMIGDKFNRLTVKEIVGKDKSGNVLYFCSCECGGSTTTRSFMLRSGRAKSCGCFHKEVISLKKERINVSRKQCSTCGVVKDISEFGKKSEAVDGHKSQCRKCGRLWHKRNPGKVAEANRYRKRKKNNATPHWVDRNALQKIDEERIDLENQTGASYEVDHIIPITHPLICGLHVPWNLQIVTAEYNNSKGNRVSEEFLQIYGLSNENNIVIDDCFVDSDPTLSSLWDRERNHPIRPNVVHLSSTLVLWWKCSKNHSWPKSLVHMQRNADCPVCSGNEWTDFSNGAISPDIAAEWDYKKNAPWTPGNFRRYSNKEVFWICENDHSYSKAIDSRTRGVGCPDCKSLGLRQRETLHTRNIEKYEFENKSGQCYRGTILEFESKFSLERSQILQLLRGQKLSYDGWFVKGKNPSSRLRKITLVHDEYGEIEGTIVDICKKYQLDKDKLYKIADPKYTDYSHRGWTLKGSKRKEKLIEVVHPDYGSFRGRAIDLINKYENLTPVGVSNVVNGKTFSHRGWSIKGVQKKVKD